jgi:chorismate mutase
MLDIIVKKNNISKKDIISAFFTATRDLDAAFPAEAARLSGWTDIPLMCSNEIDVKGSLEKCIRVMIHLNCPDEDKKIKHIYINDAKKLRPDLIK